MVDSKADVARATVEDVVDVVTEVVENVSGGRGADASEPVRRRSGQTVTDDSEHVRGQRVVRDP